MSDAGRAIRRILVALDTHPWNLSALEEAAELARDMQAELAGLFVEDVNLFRLCELPSGEVSLAGGLRRPVREALERELRGQAEFARRTLERVAAARRVSWSFTVTRGQVEETVLGAATQADLVTLSRRQRGFAPGVEPRTGHRNAVAAHYRGGAGGQRVLSVAMRLAAFQGSPLALLVPGDEPTAEAQLRQEIQAALRPGGHVFEIQPFRPSAQGLARALERARARSLVLEAGVARAIGAVLPDVGVDLLLVREATDQPASNSAT
jgi:nucleotide-binding universal stress UspA family protein